MKTLQHGETVEIQQVGGWTAAFVIDGKVNDGVHFRWRHVGDNADLGFISRYDSENVTWRRIALAEKIVETINHPSYYGGDTTYEAIKVIEAWQLDFCLGSVLKYICRAGKKDPSAFLDDMKKARWYLDRYILQHEHDKK